MGSGEHYATNNLFLSANIAFYRSLLWNSNVTVSFIGKPLIIGFFIYVNDSDLE